MVQGADAIALDTVVRAVVLMGIAIALRFPTDLCLGGLQGLQRQVLSNSVVAGMGMLRGIGAVVVLYFFSATIEAYFLWQIVVGLVEMAAAHALLWRALPSGARIARIRPGVLVGTWRYAAGMAGISLVCRLAEILCSLSRANSCAHVFDATQHRRHAAPARICTFCQQFCERRFPGTGWPPKQHRVQLPLGCQPR